jgi:hypothetical protein
VLPFLGAAHFLERGDFFEKPREKDAKRHPKKAAPQKPNP